MKIVIRGRCRDAETKEEWDETLTVTDDYPIDDAYKQVLQYFNETLHAGEHRREFVSAELVGKSDRHEWEKTNLVTIMEKRGNSYDEMRCKKCGSTGRRYGVGPGILVDKKFKKNQNACPVLG